jgi:hypothetical protein
MTGVFPEGKSAWLAFAAGAALAPGGTAFAEFPFCGMRDSSPLPSIKK